MRGACRRDGFAKIFQQPLDAKKEEKNRLRGIDIASALTTGRGTEVRAFAPDALLEWAPVLPCALHDGYNTLHCCSPDARLPAAMSKCTGVM